jgi:hypothetical protein
MHPDDILLNEYVDEALGPEERNDVQRHLDDCASCRATVADLRTLARAARALRDQTIEPPARVWSGIERATGHGGRSGVFGSRVGLATAAVLALGVASALLAGGVALGRRMPVASQPDPQLVALRQELHDTRQMVMLSLLQQQSASERLNGVMWTNRIDNPGNEVVAALLDTLMHDSNINVRLATIDALKRFGADTSVRRGAVEALGRQTSPLVQIALIDFIAETNGPGSADVLRRLSQDQMADQAVRARAALAAQRVG